jgi:hypothetical protein
MNNLLRIVLLGVILVSAGPVLTHHNTQAEFGSFGSDTLYVEGTITRVSWTNPHIAWDVTITGGDLPVGERWRALSHPVHVQEEYGFDSGEFAVGDTLKMHVWKHLRDTPLMWPRAIQVNDGPMKSNLRFTDMIDIADGTFAAKKITLPANFVGSPPGRAGTETLEKLREMGLLDERGLLVMPPGLE